MILKQLNCGLVHLTKHFFNFQLSRKTIYLPTASSHGLDQRPFEQVEPNLDLKIQNWLKTTKNIKFKESIGNFEKIII
jgi:hypothetical protein